MSDLNDGDFWGLEGNPQWWWKYVTPPPERFYAQLLAELAKSEEPQPAPWLQQSSAHIMESLVMFHAAVRMGEREGSARLKAKAYARLSHAVRSLGAESGFIGVDQEGGPIGPRTRISGEAHN